MLSTNLMVQGRSCKIEISHVLSFVSLFMSMVWIVIFSSAIFLHKRIQDILSNSLARRILFLMAFLSIVTSFLSIGVDIKEIANEIKEKKQNDYRKKLLLEILSVISTCFFICSSILELYSQFSSNEYTDKLSTNFSLVSELFLLLSVLLILYIGAKKVKTMQISDDQLNDDENLSSKNDRKFLLWKVTNDTVLFVTTVINTLYIIDDILEEKISGSDYKTHNVIRLINLLCCVTVAFSILILNHLEKSSSGKVKNVNISYSEQNNLMEC